ncbi:MAG: hypothetical protein Q8L48_27775 [Archangium sp.]|nr:hypothetical protein [Archangium sp.]
MAGFECCPVVNVCRPVGASCLPPGDGGAGGGGGAVGGGGGGSAGGGGGSSDVVSLPFKSDDAPSTGFVLPHLFTPSSLTSTGDAVYVLARSAPGCAAFNQTYQPALTRFDVADGGMTWAWTTALPAGAIKATFVVGPEGATVVGSGALTGQTSQGGNEAFVVRVRPDGSLAWVRQFGTIFEDSADEGFLSFPHEGRAANNVLVRPDGTTLVAGTTRGALAGQSPHGGADVFLAKLGVNGALDWVRLFGSPNDEGVTSLTALPDGTVVLAGKTDGVMEPGHVNQQTAELFLCGIDPAGATLWTRQRSVPGHGFVHRWGDDLAWVGSWTFDVLRFSGDGGLQWATDWNPDAGTASLISEFVPLDAQRASVRGFRSLPTLFPTPWDFELFEYQWSGDGGFTATQNIGGGWPQVGAMLVQNPLLASGRDGSWYAGGSVGVHPAPNNIVTVTRQSPVGGAREELRNWLFDDPRVGQRAQDRANIYPRALSITDDGSRVMMGNVTWGGCTEADTVWLMRF